jgi:hypothetical protein
MEGCRILTVYLYLNDVEEGGGTNFPVLDLTVMPKQGRVVLWPSVLDSNPHDMDNRTNHQALPVVQGVKVSWTQFLRGAMARFSHCLPVRRECLVSSKKLSHSALCLRMW